MDLVTLSMVAPELTVLVMACLLLLLSSFRLLTKQLLYFTTQITLVLAIFLLLTQLDLMSYSLFHDMFLSDNITRLLKLIVLIVSFFVVLYARDYIAVRDFPQAEYYVLSLLAVFGMMILISAENLLLLYLGLELLSLPLYALAALHRQSATATEAASKYFILGALASGLLLYGMSLLFGATDSLMISEIMHRVQQGTAPILLTNISLIFIVAAICFKLGIAPFHAWVPDFYQGAPNSVVLLVASASKIAAFSMIIRFFMVALPHLAAQWAPCWLGVGLFSIALGNLSALFQHNVKRLLGYSAVANMGYMSLALGLGVIGFAPALFYMVAYTLTALVAFAILVMLSRHGIELENLEDLRGLHHREPWLAFLLLLVAFSMAGIPPVVGFFAKLWILQMLVSSGYVWIAVSALLLSVVGAYYYLRIVQTMYFDEPKAMMFQDQPFYVDTRIGITLNGLFILYLGLFPAPLMALCQWAVR